MGSWEDGAEKGPKTALRMAVPDFAFLIRVKSRNYLHVIMFKFEYPFQAHGSCEPNNIPTKQWLCLATSRNMWGSGTSSESWDFPGKFEKTDAIT